MVAFEHQTNSMEFLNFCDANFFAPTTRFFRPIFDDTVVIALIFLASSDEMPDPTFEMPVPAFPQNRHFKATETPPVCSFFVRKCV